MNNRLTTDAPTRKRRPARAFGPRSGLPLSRSEAHASNAPLSIHVYA